MKEQPRSRRWVPSVRVLVGFELAYLVLVAVTIFNMFPLALGTSGLPSWEVHRKLRMWGLLASFLRVPCGIPFGGGADVLLISWPLNAIVAAFLWTALRSAWKERYGRS